nr:hypothetical protein [uncultured Caproiciproducens sp.]
MSKILVAYSTHSENTKVIAETIQKIAGDLFKIRMVETYPAEYNAVVDVAKKNKMHTTGLNWQLRLMIWVPTMWFS